MRKDGVGIYLEMALTIIRDGANQVIGALAIARDITERRAQERAQRDRMAGLEQQVAVLFRGVGVT
jgi:PAS domain-containing protein